MSGSPFNFPLALNKVPWTPGFNGDQLLVSQDQSIFREGTNSMLVAGPLWVLAGNQPVMKYWSHNTAIDDMGNFMVRDEADNCSLVAFCEDNTMRYFGAPTGPRHTLPVFTLYLTISMLTGAVTYVGAVIPSQTVGITGTTTNNSANAGAVGELLTATIASAGTSLSTGVSANVITTPFLSLTAGDWDVWGTCCFLPAATTSITQIACGISVTTATLPAAGSGLLQETHAALVPTAIPQCYVVPEMRISIASTTPYYLVAQSTFTLSTMTAFGTLYARRRR